jgi:methionyl-tRNA formyltransferase
MIQCVNDSIPQSRFLRHASLRRAHARPVGRGWIPFSLVVTQPDRPKGAASNSSPLQSKNAPLQLGLPIVQPESIKNNADFRAQLDALKPDAIIVVGYGRIIPQWMLDLPPLGNINLHASLCRNIAAPRPFSGRLRGVKPSPESPR